MDETKSKVNEAVDCFNNGFNCSQAILSTYCEQFGLDKITALKLSCGLGAGMGRLGETCGAVTVDGQESGPMMTFKNRITRLFSINGRNKRASFLSVLMTGKWHDVDYGHGKWPDVVKMTRKCKYVYF